MGFDTIEINLVFADGGGYLNPSYIEFELGMAIINMCIYSVYLEY